MSVLLLSLALSFQDATQEVDPLAPLPEPEIEQVIDAEVAPPEPAPEVARARNCPTRTFRGEIVFDETPPRRSAVILCADSNDPADYVAMLESAKREVAFNDRFTVASRSELMARIDEELAALAEEASAPVEDPATSGR